MAENTVKNEKELKKTWEGGIAVVPPAYRNLRGIDMFFLWSGASIGVFAWLYGAFLKDAGFVGGITAIIIGSVVGSIIFALVGILGSDHGLAGMVSTRASFGIRGSYIPAVLNIIQLVFWTGMMVWINTTAVQEVSVIIGFPFEYVTVTAIAGAICTAIALGGAIAWKGFTRIASVGLIILSIAATWSAFQGVTLTQAQELLPYNGLGVTIAIDMAIGMPLSWAPLVNDYTRFAKSSKGAFWGALVGYAPAMIWFYTVGLILVAVTGYYNPAPAMSVLGLGIPALVMIWFGTVTTTFLDIYSGAMSILDIIPRIKAWQAITFVGVVGTILALLPWLELATSFILMIGAVFIPLFAIVLGHYFVFVKRKLAVDDLYSFKPSGAYWYTGGFSISAIVSLIIGFVIYWVIENTWLVWLSGSAVSFVVTLIVYIALYKVIRR